MPIAKAVPIARRYHCMLFTRGVLLLRRRGRRRYYGNWRDVPTAKGSPLLRRRGRRRYYGNWRGVPLAKGAPLLLIHLCISISIAS